MDTPTDIDSSCIRDNNFSISEKKGDSKFNEKKKSNVQDTFNVENMHYQQKEIKYNNDDNNKREEEYHDHYEDDDDEDDDEESIGICRYIKEFLFFFCLQRPDVLEFRKLMNMDEEGGLKYNKKLYIAKESVFRNKKHVLTIILGILLICFIFTVFSIVVTCYITGIRSSDLTYENIKKAGQAVGLFARDSAVMLQYTSQIFINNLREEYKRRQKKKEELMTHGIGEFEESGMIGNLPDTTVSDQDGTNNDPIDWRHHPHPYLNEIIDKYKDPSHFLPKVCPMLKNHLEIDFNMSENSFDVFGYPCVMEMHWSQKMTDEEVDYLQQKFITQENLAQNFNIQGSLTNKGKGFIPSNPYEQSQNHQITNSVQSQKSKGRVNPIHFGNIHCSRNYRLNGFTEWKCKPSHKIPSKYTIIYSVGCTEVDQKGDINVASKESTYKSSNVKRPWVDITKNETSNINPAYDKNVQAIKSGHYCYINYAFVYNNKVTKIMRNIFVSNLVNVLVGFFLIMFIVVEKTTLIVWFLSFLLNVITFLTFFKLFYDYTNVDLFEYLILEITSILITCCFVVLLNIMAFYSIIKGKFKYNQSNIPLLYRMFKSMIIIFEDSHVQSPQQIGKPKYRYYYDQHQDFEKDVELREENYSYALQPGDRGYGDTTEIRNSSHVNF